MRIRWLWRWPALFAVLMGMAASQAAPVAGESAGPGRQMAGGALAITPESMPDATAAPPAGSARVRALLARHPAGRDLAPRAARVLSDRLDALARGLMGSLDRDVAATDDRVVAAATLVQAAEELRSPDKASRRSGMARLVRWAWPETPGLPPGSDASPDRPAA